MKLPSEIRFADEIVKKSFYDLKTGDKSDIEIYDFISQAFENIGKNAFCGIQIPKRLIPKEYFVKYGTGNLWKYNLPNAWRLLYSIKGSKAIVISVILEWMDHKSYERKFNY